ncbi:leucine-rich repeat domain-containing protein [Polaribacter sp. Hel1_85]|uniref:leucine-rich repeat domain-containing protein n=1 Tax=Polaribacter sp. Hel1_85 TaxID=1250005 RepID=UPI00052BF5EA|nr:leucine-rich repeat domain-containing protein [Polaribacter sp. Hel1_85]KGL58953.1 leucine-rich repeat protein (LRR) protein [Polaribacter sp. Hel1_85]
MKTKLLLFFMLFSALLQAQISQTEREALIEIYNATGGDNWTNNTNWDTDPNSNSDVSTWHGVSVEQITGQDYVRQINLSNNNLNGTVPNSINYLVRLHTLDISKNNFITGLLNIEDESNHLLNLNSSDTGISSLKLPRNMTLNIKNTPNLGCVEVPTTSVSYYGSLSMDYFDLGVKITDNCSGISNLDAIERDVLETIYNATNGNSWSSRTYSSVDNNYESSDLKGIETAEFGGVRKLTKLYLSGMNLNGALPSEIDDFSELLELNLSQNQLNLLPTEIGNLSKLTSLNINSNYGITTLPAVVGNLAELVSLTFSNTQIDLFPTSLGNLSKLKNLEFASTRITLLPPEIGNLSELTRLVAAPNNIASIPTEFGQLTKLTYLDFANCQISNTPAAFANLTELETLYLNNNQIQVVSGLGGFTKLKRLRLHDNRLGEDNPNFNTDLPSDLGDLVLLEELTLNNNKLTSLPISIGNLILIKELPLEGNKLTTLPSTVGNLTSLEELYLGNASGHGNELTSLPAEIGNLSNLKILYVQYNRLTSLPIEIGDLSNLEYLDVSNQITYNPTTYYMTSLPASMNNLTSLKDFKATGNRIEGDIDISSITTLTNLQFYDNRISGLKLGVGPFYSQFTSNPNLSCIEVPTAEVTNWENDINNQVYTDNGVAFSDNCTGYRIPQLEREALIAFYNATDGGTSWTGQFWDTDPNSLSNVGAWAGVTTAIVNGQKHVVKIELISRNLNGFIPSEIKDLTELQEFVLHTNGHHNLNEIKPEIGQLSKLVRLDLTGQSISTLPTEIGNLSSLTYLNLSNNELTSLPTGIGNFAVLEELIISNQTNRTNNTKTLTSLPDEIGNITSLKKFDITGNVLTTLPTTIGGLTSLEELYLGNTSGHGNELTSLPAEIGNLSNLKILYVQYNRLTSLPIEIGDLSNLEYLDVSNQITYNPTTYYMTSLPASMNNLTSLKDFKATGNRIEGDIDISSITTLTNLQFYDNRISGLKLGVGPFYSQFTSNPNLSCIEVPTAEVTNWENDINNQVYTDNGVAFSDNCTGYRVPQLEREALIAFYNATDGGTSWTGQFWDTDPNSLSNVGAWAGVTTALINGQKHVVKIDLTNRHLNGFVPSEIKGLTELQELILNASSLGIGLLTEIKPEIGQLSKLVRLDLTGQSISTLPIEIGNLSSLTYLNLSNNELTSLPTGIGNFAVLEELIISNQTNRTNNTKTLTSLPDEIGSIASLKKFDITGNALTSLPSTVGNLTSLEELYLGNASGHGNELTSLPAEIGNLSNLKILYVQYNRLTSLPIEIGDLSNLEYLDVSNQITYNPTTYYMTSLPASMNNLTSLKDFKATGNRIEGDIDISSITTLTNLQFYDNRISGLKLGVGPFYSQFTSNPNLSCIEVPTAEVTNWENDINNQVYTDNGVAFSDNCTGYRVPQLEREALIAFYNATDGGTNWTGQFWDTDPNSLSNVGAWAGVTTALINGQKHVVKIDLTNRHLNGLVPSEIKDLTELQELILNASSLGIGLLTEIKPEIGQLSKLVRLDLTGQSISTLPTEIGNLSSLTYLNLSNNELTSLPTGIGNFAVLEELIISNQTNRTNNTKTLTSLPDEIGNIASLKKLYLNQNKLGSIPITIGNLSSLEILDLENNEITSLPVSINNLNTLKEFLAAYNFIEGALDLSNLTVLNRLYLQYNNISGLKLNLAPTAFNDSQYYLNLTRNALGCIEVPNDELVSWQLSNYTEENYYIDNGVVFSDNCSAVSNNSIPDIEREALIAIYNSTNGSSWNNDLSENSYFGVPWVADVNQKRNVGAWFGVTTAVINGQKHVTKVELNSNKLKGIIPSEIKNLTQLKELELNNNSISSLPTEIGELVNLEQLTITSQYNSTGAEYVLKRIPTEINNITSLRRLDISSNAIDDNLDFSNLTNLTALSVSSNQITGLKIGVSPNVFDNQNQDGFSNSFSFYNQYLNCIVVPQNTIADWEASSFASSYPNIVWGQDCNAYNNVPQGEIQALVDMYNNLDGENWTNNTNWTGSLAKATENPPYNATKWQGVTTKIVDGGKHITIIQMSNNKLEGTISSSIGNLSKLETLNLSSNKLIGMLPEEMSNLSSLKTAYFQSNELSGKVPDFSGISTLEILYISNNKFQFGDFEDEFTTYKSLPTFEYLNQSKVGEEEDKSFGNTGFSLEAEVSGENNEYQWYKNGAPITDATSKTYIITEASVTDNGYYFCYVTNTVVDSLTIQTENVTLNYDAALSVEGENFAKSFKLYPNPVQNSLQIRNDSNNKILSIEIFNLLGKKIQVVNNPLNLIDVSQLSKGIYLMNIITEKGRTTKRIMKK